MVVKRPQNHARMIYYDIQRTESESFLIVCWLFWRWRELAAYTHATVFARILKVSWLTTEFSSQENFISLFKVQRIFKLALMALIEKYIKTIFKVSLMHSASQHVIKWLSQINWD